MKQLTDNFINSKEKSTRITYISKISGNGISLVLSLKQLDFS